MSPERWQLLEDLVERASALPEAEREPFLQRECHDPELLAEALSLTHFAFEERPELENAIRSVAQSVTAEADAATADRWIGRQLGPYRLTRQVGRGGMGTVYEAQRDDDFHMRVAIKLVHGEFVSEHLLRRMRMERQILARLQHPYIARLLDGASVDGLPYLVMEYVDGCSVSEYCKQHDLSTAARLEVFEKVCRAVAYAHEHGVVHRDLKPSNIFVEADGTPKLLDFGIAKLLDDAGQPAQTALTATGFRAMTPEYASPEQILGEAIGPRSDIYSLGAVLFELLTDQQAQPIQTDSPVAIAQAVCSTETDVPSKVLARSTQSRHRHVGRDLDHVVAKAVRKDPAQRYASAVEFADDVRHYLDGLPVLARRRALSYRVSRWLRRRRTYAIAALLLIAIAAVNWVVYRKYFKAEVVDWAFSKLSEDSGDVMFPVLSPDGTSSIYCARQTDNWNLLWVHAGSNETPRNLTKGSRVDNIQPAFAPDGLSIAFRSERDGGGIFRMQLSNGQVRKVSELGFNPSWSPDARQIVVGSERILSPDNRTTMKSLLYVIDVASGKHHPLVDLDAVQPSWSPHGWRIAYWNTEGGRRNIFTINADGTGARAVTSDSQTNWNPVWAPDGRTLFFVSDRGNTMNLWQVSIDERTGAVLGRPIPIGTPSSYSGQISIARNVTRLAFVQSDLRCNLNKIRLDPKTLMASGQFVVLTQGSRQVKDPNWSPDGSEIVFQDVQSKQEDIYVISRDGFGQRRLTNDAFRDRIPRWSPDGKFVLYYSNRSGRYELWRMGRDGSANQQLTHTQGPSVLHGLWSPDQQSIGYNVLGSSPYVASVESLGEPGKFPGERMPDLGSATTAITDWSPDGKRLAGFVGSSGVITYDIASRTYRQWTQSGRDVMWMKDSRYLLYRDTDTLYALDTRTGASHTVFSIAPLKFYGRFSISPEQTEIVYPVTSTSSDLWLAEPEH